MKTNFDNDIFNNIKDNRQDNEYKENNEFCEYIYIYIYIYIRKRST